MASPASYNFVITRDQLITDALLHIGAIGEGETPSANAVTEAARILNMLLKVRANEIPLWSIRRGTILPITEVSSIDTNQHVVINYDTTTISADEASGQTTLTVTTTSGMATSDQIGIECDDGTMHWTTIASVDDGTTVTIDEALDDEASSGNRVFWYTAASDRVIRPVRILSANILELINNTSWEITIEERTDYFNLGNRTTSGIPNRIFYSPILGSRTADPTSASTWYGIIYVYPRFEGGDHVVEFTYQEPIQDVDSATDNLYVPQEFYLPVWLELCALLGTGKYSLPKEQRDTMFALAEKYRKEALETTFEEGSLFLQPEDENA